MPAFMPDTTATGDREDRAQEAADRAEYVRGIFKDLAARHAAEAIALAAKLGVEPDARKLKRSQAAGKTFAQDLAEYMGDVTYEMFHLPDPSEAYAEVMGDD